ncbi:MAG: hypothetical protein WCB26_15280, partial [Pseudolabrys sp.]
SGLGAESRNFLLLAGTARKKVSARTTLHARAWTKMARKARSFWLSKRFTRFEIELDGPTAC